MHRMIIMAIICLSLIVFRCHTGMLKYMKSLIKISVALIALILAGCVNVDPESGKTIPRGNQKFKFATVERRAEQLRDGMTKLDVVMLLGSPAETGDGGEVWMYLPERPAVLVPTRALRLVFKGNILESHGYTTIVLGQGGKP
jgi:outer membrane protein assembly factor BamE (lipoprotein component of BamABCDE complex)